MMNIHSNVTIHGTPGALLELVNGSLTMNDNVVFESFGSGGNFDGLLFDQGNANIHYCTFNSSTIWNYSNLSIDHSTFSNPISDLPNYAINSMEGPLSTLSPHIAFIGFVVPSMKPCESDVIFNCKYSIG